MKELRPLYRLGWALGSAKERLRILTIIYKWARERDLGVDALVAKIHNAPVVQDDEFEVPDFDAEWSEAFAKNKKVRPKR
jgi:hypothetical protein